MYNLPKSFCDRISCQITDSVDFFKGLDSEAPTSIRLHPSKRHFANIHPEGKLVPWNKDGLYLAEKVPFFSDPNYHSGLFYPMEAASMFLHEIFKQHFDCIDPLDILDLCASPGGKTLMIKDYFQQSILVSNEIDKSRVHVLKENAIRWGTQNHIVIQSEAKRLIQSGLKFDLILVDAPCSGEGLFRKDKKSREEWDENRSIGCASRQETILEDAVQLLKPGGYIVYSTCTYNPLENINQVKKLTTQFNFSSKRITLDDAWKIEELVDNDLFAYQFWPHRTLGEGFFVSLLHSREDDSLISYAHRTKKRANSKFPFLPEIDLSEYQIQEFDKLYFAFTEKELQFTSALKQNGNIIKKGLYLGEIKGNDFIPSYDFAMNLNALKMSNSIELNEEDALLFLSGNSLNRSTSKGVVLLLYNGLGIGFGKSNGVRINNMYPKHLRIRTGLH